jgi:acetate kinase
MDYRTLMRNKILEGLEGIGMVYDPKKNELSHTRNVETIISKPESEIPIYIIPTDEELVMTEDAYALIKDAYDVHTKFTYTFQSRNYVNKGRVEELKNELARNPELAEIIAHPK